MYKKCKPFSIISILCLVVIAGFVTQIIQVYGEPVLGSTVFEFTSSGVSGASYTVTDDGTYTIRCKGAQGGAFNLPSGKGGDLTASIKLKAGDKLVVTRLAGGTCGSGYSGGDAVIVSLNGTYIIGAGGAGGNYETYSGSFQRMAASVEQINNSLFSSGAGGGVAGRNYSYTGTSGNTIAGCSAAGAASGAAGQSGTNYLNTTSCTLVNNVGGSLTVGVIVTYAQEAKITKEDLQLLSDRITVLENNNKKDAAKMMACENQEFDVRVYSFDSNAITTQAINIVQKGVTVGTITLKNEVQGDGYIQVKGIIKESGYFEIPYDKDKIVIYVIEEPNSSNVTAVFN